MINVFCLCHEYLLKFQSLNGRVVDMNLLIACRCETKFSPRKVVVFMPYSINNVIFVRKTFYLSYRCSLETRVWNITTFFQQWLISDQQFFPIDLAYLDLKPRLRFAFHRSTLFYSLKAILNHKLRIILLLFACIFGTAGIFFKKKSTAGQQRGEGKNILFIKWKMLLNLVLTFNVGALGLCFYSPQRTQITGFLFLSNAHTLCSNIW